MILEFLDIQKRMMDTQYEISHSKHPIINRLKLLKLKYFTYPKFRAKIDKDRNIKSKLLSNHPEEIVYETSRFISFVILWKESIIDRYNQYAKSVLKMTNDILSPQLLINDMMGSTERLQLDFKYKDNLLSKYSIIIRDNSDSNPYKEYRDKLSIISLHVDIENYDFVLTESIYDTNYDDIDYSVKPLLKHTYFVLDNEGKLINENHRFSSRLRKEDNYYYSYLSVLILVYLNYIVKRVCDINGYQYIETDKQIS